MNVGQALEQTVAILLQPQAYFSDEDGALDFGDGTVYVTYLSLAGAIAAGVFGGGLFTMGATGLFSGLLILAITPVVAIVLTFVAAIIIYLICQFLDSRKDFVTSFSIAAATAALYPVTAIINMIPVVGFVAGLVWSWWLVSEGVTAKHNVDRGSSRLVFGLVYGLLALLTVIF